MANSGHIHSKEVTSGIYQMGVTFYFFILARLFNILSWIGLSKQLHRLYLGAAYFIGGDWSNVLFLTVLYVMFTWKNILILILPCRVCDTCILLGIVYRRVRFYGHCVYPTAFTECSDIGPSVQILYI